MKIILLPLVLTASLLATACTSVFSDVRATFDYALSSNEDASMTSEELREFPYTAVYANWPDLARIMLVLGYVDGDEFHWISGDRETLVTLNGRVVRTAMLDYELVSTSNLANDPLRCILQDECSSHWVRDAQFANSDGDSFSRAVTSEFSVVGKQEVSLPMGPRDTFQVVERGYFGLNADGKNKQRFTNYFWLEADGHVVKSEQTLLPGRAALTLMQVKWVGRDE